MVRSSSRRTRDPGVVLRPVEYALLYTFSTIPQTLAAALGVLAAFVLYRLQSDSATLWQDAQELVNQFGAAQWAAAAPEVTLGDLMGDQKYEMLLAELKRAYAERDAPAAGTTRYLAYVRFKSNLAARRRILSALKVAFWATAAVILLSVILLCTAHAFYDCTDMARAALVLGFASVSACLWLYWLLIRAALWNPADKPIRPN
jgi:hypothetical protein